MPVSKKASMPSEERDQKALSWAERYGAGEEGTRRYIDSLIQPSEGRTPTVGASFRMSEQQLLLPGEVHALVEQYAPDRLRRAGGSFLVFHKGHTYIVAYSDKDGWAIWEPEVLRLPIQGIECTQCGLAIIFIVGAAPLGWRYRGGDKWYCPNCI